MMAAACASCSSAPRRTTPELGQMEGKKVALVEIDSEDTARKIIEVSLVNELTSRGTFLLVSREEVEAARKKPDRSPLDLKGIARDSGADFALKAKVLQFDADTHEGYSKEEVEDSQLAEERGDDGKTERLYKVRALQGKVRVELTFVPVSGSDVRTGVAEATDEVTVEGKTSAAHLPPKLRFLEKLTQTAFREFFNRYN